jgi:hypothetical protein
MAFSEALDTFVWVLADGQSSLLMFDLAIFFPPYCSSPSNRPNGSIYAHYANFSH